MINVVGLGPGSKKYILPIATELIEGSDIVIGASRNLDSVKEYCRKSLDLSIGFSKIAEYLIEHKNDNISVIVSGDTGFFSMLSFVKRHIDTHYINVIPGISSLQYFYSRLKLGYENSKWLSLHGRENDISTYIRNREEVALLTDKKQNSQYIASLFTQKDGVKIYIGENLSYPEEKISCLNVDEAIEYKPVDLSVVVIRYD